MPKIYKKDIIDFFSKSKQACFSTRTNGSAKSTYNGQRDRVRFLKFFSLTRISHVRDFVPSRLLLPEKSRERVATRLVDREVNSLEYTSLESPSRGETFTIVGGPRSTADNERVEKLSLDQPDVSLRARAFIRSFFFLAPSKFRARIEIEARSPGDREAFPKMYNKFLSVFRHPLSSPPPSHTRLLVPPKLHTGTKRSLRPARFPMHLFFFYFLSPSITAFFLVLSFFYLLFFTITFF